MKVLDYLYIGLYRLLLNTNQKDFAEYSAVVFFTVGLSIYLIIFLGFFGFDANKYFPIKGFAYASVLLIGVGNYLRYMRTGRYKTLNEKYLKSSPQEQRLNNVLSIIFFVGSFASLIIHKIVTT